MSRVVPFPVRRSFPLRGTPALRVVAIVILLCFTVAVVWTAVVSLTGARLSPDSRALGPGTAR